MYEPKASEEYFNIGEGEILTGLMQEFMSVKY